jgi:hypothetical protein
LESITGTTQMKKLITSLALLALSACQYDSVGFTDAGTLTGYDVRMCACCGGIFVAIKGATYRFFELPKNTSLILDGSTKFPVQVRLSWVSRQTSCAGDHLINVTQIALSN